VVLMSVSPDEAYSAVAASCRRHRSWPARDRGASAWHCVKLAKERRWQRASCNPSLSCRCATLRTRKRERPYGWTGRPSISSHPRLQRQVSRWRTKPSNADTQIIDTFAVAMVTLHDWMGEGWRACDCGTPCARRPAMPAWQCQNQLRLLLSFRMHRIVRYQHDMRVVLRSGHQSVFASGAYDSTGSVDSDS